MRRAFVFGNVAIDEVFKVRALPQAGASVLGQTVDCGLGGKGANQAIAIARTGLPTTLIAAVGTDWHGQLISEALSQEPVQCELIERHNLPTDRSVIFAQEDGDNVIVTTSQSSRSITYEDCAPLLSQSKVGDPVLIQGNLRLDVTEKLCREARRRGAFVVINPSPFDVGFCNILHLADALFVNQSEANGLTGLSHEAAAKELQNTGATQVIITLGAEGSLLASGDRLTHVPAAPAQVVDVTGAGDCFEGVAVGSALLRGECIDETALRHASAAAAITIAGLGAVTAFPDAGEVARIMKDLGTKPCTDEPASNF